jgi:uncharacterized protein (TIGR03000 family)
MHKQGIGIVGAALTLAMAGWTPAQEKVESQITILVPAKGFEESAVKVNGKDLKGQGTTRLFTASLEPGKAYRFNIEVLIQPNNYTKITRYQEITLKGGAKAKVDLTVRNPHTDLVRIPWVPTPDDIVDEMAKLAKVGKYDVVYDLGCGDGVMLIRPIQLFGAKKGVGIETDPKILARAKENVKKAKLEDRIELRLGDLLNVEDVAEASVILLYIGNDLGELLQPLLQKNCKPGTRIVSHRFALGNWPPTRSVTIRNADGEIYDLHLWIVDKK